MVNIDLEKRFHLSRIMFVEYNDSVIFTISEKSHYEWFNQIDIPEKL